MEHHRCPVCGFTFPEGARAPYDESGGSFDICPCCLYEYGVSDGIKGVSIESWRQKWVQNGAKWPASARNPMPKDWDARKQLSNVGIDLDDVLLNRNKS